MICIFRTCRIHRLKNIIFQMTFHKSILLFFVVLLSLSCGEDRTYEYEAKTQHNKWMVETMQQWYLWGDLVTEQEWKSYFAKPADFFARIVKSSGSGDKWSYCSIDTMRADHHPRGKFNHLDSYGMDFVLMNDPTGATTRSYARVTSVMKNSPAEKCGIRRNDFISRINGVNITTKNADGLVKGPQRDIEVCRIGTGTNEGELVWTDSKTIQLQQSEYVEDHAFAIDTVYVVNGVRIGYVMCNRLLAKTPELEGIERSYSEEMDAVFSNLKNCRLDELVIDLRLCNDGDLDMANKMASYILPNEFSGNTFVQTFWNENKTDMNSVVMYDEEIIRNGLQINRVFVITSNYTQGAAEWFIQGLRTTMGADNVVLIGMSTAGMNVQCSPIQTEYGFTLYPATCYVADSDGNYNYGKGIEPDMLVNELEYVELLPYGNMSELLLNMTVDVIMSIR